jgi:long-chain acyl-CoA synthetase
MEQQNFIVRYLFQKALESGKDRYDNGLVGASPLYNFAICKKIQAMLGGRLTMAFTGSAPLQREVQEFSQTVFNCEIRQGYGMTETCAATCIQELTDTSMGIGAPVVTACILLEDWAEGGYMNDDYRTHGMYRGEILIGGPCVTPGYFISDRNPDKELSIKNKEEFCEVDGIHFIRSGDIGQILPNGTLQIIDRKKDLWKGPNGEYVAFSKVENNIKLCPYVDMCMCVAPQNSEYHVMLICLNEPAIKHFANEKGIQGILSDMCTNADIVQEVMQELKAVAKTQGLLAFEIPKKFALLPDQWTVENDLLTAAMKMKRPVITKKYEKEIQSLYKT